jgi:hypothetical protein
MPVISRYVAYSPSTRQHQSPKNTQHQVRRQQWQCRCGNGIWHAHTRSLLDTKMANGPVYCWTLSTAGLPAYNLLTADRVHISGLLLGYA